MLNVVIICYYLLLIIQTYIPPVNHESIQTCSRYKIDVCVIDGGLSKSERFMGVYILALPNVTKCGGSHRRPKIDSVANFMDSP